MRREAENATALAPTHEDIEGLVWKVTLLEGELAKVRRAREVADGKFNSLSNAAADDAWRLVVYERERWVQFEELSLL
jgi:hypothetical protein